ncbi:hypothetical protein [Novispirillum itersonii]|uniref:hypothetical protein n=1 Tax=Novispirillum itersonii TaxID=189 RepID=UPI0003803956|nr:hypothetical protein [Novispirillum itersonii]
MTDKFDVPPGRKRGRRKKTEPDHLLSFDAAPPADVSGESVGIYYTDSDGDRTKRIVTFRWLTPPHFGAHCWLRGEYRTFRMDRVSDVVDRDGQVLSGEDFFKWMGHPIPDEVRSQQWADADRQYQLDPLPDESGTTNTQTEINNKGCLLAVTAVLSSGILTIFGLSEILIFLSLAFLVLAVAAAFKPSLYPVHTKMRRANAFAAYFLVALTFFGGCVISLPKAEKQAAAPPKVTAKSASSPADLRKDRVISYGNSAGFISGLRLLIPKLTEENKTESGQVETLSFYSIPSRTRVVIETAPGLGVSGAALLSVDMVRPMTDKPSAYDGGLKATLEQILMTAASNWPMADQKAFIAACQPVLSGPECDRTIKSVRVTITRFGADLFRMVVQRENAAAGG